MPLNIEHLPDEVRERVLTKRREAFESELKKIGDRIESEGAWHRSNIESEFQQIFVRLNQEAASGRERELADLKKYESDVIAALKMESLKRRGLRTKNGKAVPQNGAAGAENESATSHGAGAAQPPPQKLTGLQALLNSTPFAPSAPSTFPSAAKPSQPSTQQGATPAGTVGTGQQEGDAFALSQDATRAASDQKKSDDNSTRKVAALLKTAKGHINRKNLDLASRSISEALELDPFNRDVLELDAKIREAQETENFGETTPTAGASKTIDQAASKADRKAAKKQILASKRAAAIGRRKKSSPVIPVLVTTVVLGLIGVGVLYYDRIPVIRLHDGVTMAVLPWKTPGTTQGRDADLAAAATSLPEILNNQLMRSGASSTRFLGFKTSLAASRKSKDAETAVRSFGFTHVVRGNIRRDDSIYTVVVELSDSTRETIWSATYKRELTGLAIVPFEICASLQRFIDGDSIKSVSPPGSLEIRNPESHMAYLKGLHSLHGADRASIDDAVASFTRSTQLDSVHAGSYAGLAAAFLKKARLNATPPPDLLADAQLAAQTAIMLSPETPDGYEAMAGAYIDMKFYDSALSVLKLSEQYSPNESETSYLRAMALFLSGRLPDAREELEDASRFDPRNPEILDLYATVLQLDKAFPEAAEQRLALLPLVNDSIGYLTGRFADIIMLEPGMLLKHRERVLRAYRARLAANGNDHDLHYRYGRILQNSGDLQEGLSRFSELEKKLRAILNDSPNDLAARLTLGLTLTRLGRYNDALAMGELAAKKFPGSVEAKYVLSQIYTMQIYSNQTKTVDENKVRRALSLLREALSQGYREDMVLSADYYHLHHRADFRSAFRAEPPVEAVISADVKPKARKK